MDAVRIAHLKWPRDLEDTILMPSFRLGLTLPQVAFFLSGKPVV